MSDDANERSEAVSEPSAPPEVPHRRAFLALAAVGSCAIGASVAIPGAMLIADPLRASSSARGPKVRVAALEELEPGVPKRVTLVGDEVDAWSRAKDRRLGAVWLVRTGAREVLALSTICPHLGCGIDLAPDASSFECPCHTSAFELTGKVRSGPSPRAMDALPVEIGPKGEVVVTFTRYRIGGADAQELG